MENENNPVVDILNEAMGKLKSIVDIDTVMGDPVEMPDGSIIIPITKVSLGFVAGGGEYTNNSSNAKHQKTNYPFSGGSGAGFSIKPIGFLVNKNGNYDLITLADEPAYKKLAEMVSELCKTYIKQKTMSTEKCQEQNAELKQKNGYLEEENEK